MKSQSGANLPSVQTPSQIKKFYEPVMDMEGVSSWSILNHKKLLFSLNFRLLYEKVTGAEIGSATHELMQQINLIEAYFGNLDRSLGASSGNFSC